ncbi:MAG: hypothetical protein ACJ76F_12940 [Bacteroidia bacterium]
MKLTFTLALMALSIVLSAQNNCSGFLLSAGTRLEYEMTSYPLSFEINPDWFGMNEKKKDKEAIRISEDIAAGKIAAKSVQPMYITVNEVKEEDGKNTVFSRFTMKDTDIGLKYRCDKDSVYTFYSNGVPYPVVYNKDTLGTSVFGVKAYPLNPKVGDYIPGAINDTYMLPKESISTVKSYFNIPRGNYSYHGFVTMKQKMTVSSTTTMIYFPGLITGKEDFTVSGKTYAAYKVTTPIWFKATSTVEKSEDPETYFNDRSLSDEIKNNQKGFEEKVAKKTKRKIDKLTGANEKGYIESIEENWYVPEFGGFVKTIHYDKDGIVQFITTLKSVK